MSSTSPPTAAQAPTAAEFAQFLAQFKAMAEKVAVLEAAAAPKEEKFERTTFYHSVPGSTFIVSKKQADGSALAEVLIFDVHGELTTEDPEAIRGLNSVVDKPGSFISSTRLVGIVGKSAAVHQVITTAERSMDKLGSEATVRA